MRQAAADLRHAAVRRADRVEEGRAGAGAGVRLSRRQPRGAGDDRACQRAHHHQHFRSRFRRAGAAACRAGRALPDASRAHAARGGALLSGGARHRRRADRRMPGDLRRRAGKLFRGDRALLRAGAEAGVGGRLHQRLCDDASVGGLRRDLDALPAHGRHAGHRGGLRALGQPAGRRQPARRDGDRLRSLPAAGPRQPDPGLAAADRRGQQPEPEHGPAGPLPVRPRARTSSARCGSSTTSCIPPAASALSASEAAAGDGRCESLPARTAGSCCISRTPYACAAAWRWGSCRRGWRCRRLPSRATRSPPWRTAATGGSATTPGRRSATGWCRRTAPTRSARPASSTARSPT